LKISEHILIQINKGLIMLKKTMLISLTAAAVGIVGAGEPRLETKTKNVEKKGKKLIQTDRRTHFYNGKIWYVTHHEKGKNIIDAKGWGKFFFGLDFGRPKRSNGGWSIWNFFKFYCYTPQGHYNLLDRYLPKSVSMTKLDGAAAADFVWQIGPDGKDGQLELRAMQFKSHPKWLFLRAKLSGGKKLHPHIIMIPCYPGNSRLAKQGERHLMTKEKDYNLSVKKFKMTPTSPGMAFYSKFDLERFGNYLIIEPDKFVFAEFWKAGAGVEPRLFPKKGEREFRFALSYFNDKSPADELPRFTGETADVIYKFMENINFDPNAKIPSIDKLADEVAKLVKDKGDSKLTAKVTKIRAGYKKAAEAGNTAECGKLRQELEKIKGDIVNNSMSQFL
jgi:hypothetical protein